MESMIYPLGNLTRLSGFPFHFLDIDNKRFNIKEVLGVALEFDYVWSNDFADAPDLYLDDVKVNYGELSVAGCGLELRQMSRAHLVICGQINSIELRRNR